MLRDHSDRWQTESAGDAPQRERLVAQDAVKRLAQLEPAFRAVLDAAQVGIILLRAHRDEAGRVTEFIVEDLNRAAEILLGISQVQAVGRGGRDVWPLHMTPQNFESYVAAVELQRMLSDECTLVEPGGSTRQVRRRAVPVGDLLALSIATHAPESSLVDLQPLLDMLPESVAVLDGTGELLFRNTAWKESGGQCLSEDRCLINGNLLAGCVHAADGAAPCSGRLATSLRAFLTSRRQPFVLEYSVDHPGGKRWFSLRAEALGEGPESRVLLLQTDITARRQAEEKLRQTQRLELTGKLAAGMAHDFNNILMAVSAHADSLRRHVAPGSPAEAQLTGLQRVVEHGAKITRQLTALGRSQPLKLELLDVNAAIRDTQGLLKTLLGDQVDLRLDLTPDLHSISGDPGQLRQILMNLASNARDAMPAGGTFLVTTANATAEDAVSGRGIGRLGRFVRISVADTGTGMTEEVRMRIFEPYFTTKNHGTGLGLSTVYGIVRTAGGYIRVRSRIGEGSVFDLFLPARSGAGMSETMAQSVSMPKGRGETVLVVDDNLDVLELVGSMLEDEGYEVLLAEGGEEGLSVAQGHDGPLELLLTDVSMPRMSGPVLAQRLKELRPTIKVLMMSGYIDETHALPPEMEPLMKPFTAGELLSRVRRVLDGGSDQSESRREANHISP